MNKKRPVYLSNSATANQCGALFLSFCCALDKYCAQIGVRAERSGTARILHDAAGNTVAKMTAVTPAFRRHMAKMEHDIPELFEGLVDVYSTEGFLNTVEQMSKLSLEQIATAIAKNRQEH